MTKLNDMIDEALNAAELIRDLQDQTHQFNTLKVAHCACGWYGGSKYAVPVQCSNCNRKVVCEK